MTTVVFTVDIANRRRGDTATLDDGSGAILIAAGHAAEHQPPEPEPPRRRSRTVTSGVGGDPRPDPSNTGTS
jgi:hypothetical protein